MMDVARASGGVEAVERALTLLQCFGAAEERLSLAQLAQRSTLSKTTILRLARSLLIRGFLRRDAAGLFSLGPELARLGTLAARPGTPADVIRPALKRLSDAAQETASFYVRDGDERICLYRENAARSARHHLEEGSRHPLAHGAAGLVLRASGGDPAPETAEVRARGWALSVGDRDPELAAVACPLLDASGATLGALTISGLIGRFDPPAIERHARALLAEARRLTPQLARN